MPSNIAMDKMESVREAIRIYNTFMRKKHHTNEEYREFINTQFVTKERKKIMSLIINKAIAKNLILDEKKGFRLLFSVWADEEFSIFTEQLLSEEAKIGLRLGG